MSDITPEMLAKLLLSHLDLPASRYFSMYCLVIGATTQRAVDICYMHKTYDNYCLCIDVIGHKAYLVKNHHIVLFHTSIDIMSFDQILKEYRNFQASLLE